SEPNAGSDLASLQTKGELVGDEWVINGQKIWTSTAQYSQMCFCLVRTEPDAPKHAGISYLLIPMDLLCFKALLAGEQAANRAIKKMAVRVFNGGYLMLVKLVNLRTCLG
ncbi:MAG: acyl-CoA dehydrogenase family protein, partial [Schleiferiaceae bacterium]|nr:acyl-CoA dehydrogenase family protein [Schleiferiaceae bacterium]